MFELTDLQKIGLGLVSFGWIFLMMGLFLFLDRVLLGLGNVMLTFLSGLCLLIGLGRTLNFFWQPHNPSKMKGSAAFFFGIFLVLIGWPFIGMCVEFYGFFVLFSGFLPIVISFIRRIPVLGNLLNLPGISTLVKKYESHPMV